MTISRLRWTLKKTARTALMVGSWPLRSLGGAGAIANRRAAGALGADRGAFAVAALPQGVAIVAARRAAGAAATGRTGSGRIAVFLAHGPLLSRRRRDGKQARPGGQSSSQQGSGGRPPGTASSVR